MCPASVVGSEQRSRLLPLQECIVGFLSATHLTSTRRHLSPRLSPITYSSSLATISNAPRSLRLDGYRFLRLTYLSIYRQVSTNHEDRPENLIQGQPYLLASSDGSDSLAWQNKTDKRAGEKDEEFIAKHGDLRPTLAGHEHHVFQSFKADGALHCFFACRASSTLTRQTGPCIRTTPRRDDS